MTKDTEALREALSDLIRPIIGIDCRSAEEVHAIMCDRIKHKFAALTAPSTTPDNGGGFDGGAVEPVAWMLRSNETGEVIFDEVCVWRDRESAEDAVAEIDPELMDYSADAVPFPLYAQPPHPTPIDPVAGGEARLSRVEPVARAGIVARNAWDDIRGVGGKFWYELPDDMRALAVRSAQDGYALGRDNALADLKGPAA